MRGNAKERGRDVDEDGREMAKGKAEAAEGWAVEGKQAKGKAATPQPAPKEGCAAAVVRAGSCH
jgi:hypothetical protein